MKNFLVFALALATSLFAGWSEAGSVRCRGLFLWNGQYARANASGCQVSDTLQTDPLLFDVGFQRYRANIAWENFWRLEADALLENAHFGVRGNFRNLFLGANFSGGRDFLRSGIVSEIHTGDSLLFLGVKLERVSVGGLQATWMSEKKNNVLDTVDLIYRGNFLGRGIFLGSRLRKHTFQIEGNFWKSRREPLGDDVYAVRDSSSLFRFRSEYEYLSSWGTFSADFFWVSLEPRFFGIRTEDGKSKRFSFVPVRADVEGFDVFWKNSFLKIQTGGFFLQSNFPHHKERFYETLAPNRILDYSLLQAFSFSYFKRDYRIFGEANGFLSYLKLEKDFAFSPGNFLVQPGISANFIYAQGEFDATLESVTTSIFLRKTRTTDYDGNFKAAGAIANLSLVIKTPKRKLFLAADCFQIIPILVVKNFTKTLENGHKQNVSPGHSSGSGTSSDKNSSLHRKERLPIFKTGFVADISIGFHF